MHDTERRNETREGRQRKRSSALSAARLAGSQGIDEVGPLTGHGRFVFPGERSHDRPISENTVNVALRSMGYSKDQASAHGFQATARTILDEGLEEPIHVIEAQLAYKVRDALGNAYNRTTHIAQRRAMMQRWADYLDAAAAGSTSQRPASWHLCLT